MFVDHLLVSALPVLAYLAVECRFSTFPVMVYLVVDCHLSTLPVAASLAVGCRFSIVGLSVCCLLFVPGCVPHPLVLVTAVSSSCLWCPFFTLRAL